MGTVGEMFLEFICGFLERPASNWKGFPLRQQKPHRSHSCQRVWPPGPATLRVLCRPQRDL